MKILCVLGQHNYGDPARGQGYEYTHFLPALRALGHEVTFFDSFSRTIHPDFTAINRALLEIVDALQPDVVFCVLRGYEIWLETLTLIRQAGARLVNWATDDSWRYPQFSKFVAPVFDAWMTTSHTANILAQQDGHSNFILTQWAANTDWLAEPLPARECQYPVTFIGSAYGNRPHQVAALKARGIEVRCFGYGWEKGPVATQDIPHIIRASVISLNFSDSSVYFQGLRPHRGRQIKARVFEVPGSGGFLLTEHVEHLKDYYTPHHEVEVFQDMDDLTTKIRYYLEHHEERNAIARQGFMRTCKEHTYDIRFRDLLKDRGDITGSAYHKSVDFTAFTHIAACHHRGMRERFLRGFLGMPCQMLWGKRRGMRAARRLVFELSWQMAGRKTYTAAGLPGRLFYKES
jgi:spore maturation protein CgeB